MNFTENTEIIELGNGIYARIHKNLTNSGIIVGDDSVLVIDSLRVPSFARDLKSDVKKITDKPIKYVVDTHSHWDHSWGNEEFLDSTIIGHDNCYKEMTDPDIIEHWKNTLDTSPLWKDADWSAETKIVTVTPPNLTFSNSMTLHVGDHEVVLMYLGKAHTSSDIYIHLPKEDLLFTGDVIQKQRMPYLGDGYPKDWPETDEKIVNLNINNFVPGHGDLGKHSDMVDAKDFIHDLINQTTVEIQNGRNSEETASLVTDSLKEKYETWWGFDSLSVQIHTVYEKLSK
tara:strand:+ start:154 stop:1011 length:858 start_codon:yes stop_codon:yes gene_type:complete